MIKKFISNTILENFGYYSNEKYLKFSNIKNRDNLTKFQKENLENLIFHCYNNVPYYKKMFKDLHISNNLSVDLNKFHSLPILKKELINDDPKKITSKDLNTRKWFYDKSGGSTGEPTKFIQDIDYLKYSFASNNYYYNDILNIDERYVKKIILWGNPRDIYKGKTEIKSKMLNWFTNSIYLNSFKMSNENMDKYLKTINSYKPDLIRGYSGSLYALSQYAKEKKIEIHTPKVIVGAAENLNDEMRNLIEETFGTKIYDFYGSREVSNLAGECKEGLMHILPSNIIEIVTKNNKCVSPGETGKVIVTNLFNYSMPFIRYEIGDIATLGPKKCKCGNPLPTLKKIEGRIINQFILENGTIIPGEFFIHLIGVILNSDEIKKFQIIQENYSEIRILVVTEQLNQTEIKNINHKIRIIMGQNCNIKWDFVDDIPKTKSGKYLYTKSLISNKGM